MHPLTEYLRQIEVRAAPFGGSLQPPAGTEDLKSMAEQARERFGYTLPLSYLDLLSVADGVDFNGYSLYASKTQPLQGEESSSLYGFLEMNELWEEYDQNNDHHLLVFGETGDDLFLFDQRDQKFKVTDKVGGDAYQEFDTFEELAEQLFKNALGIFEDEDEA